MKSYYKYVFRFKGKYGNNEWIDGNVGEIKIMIKVRVEILEVKKYLE